MQPISKDEFVTTIQRVLKEGDILDNPSKGTSTIKKITDDVIAYMRGKSRFYVKFDDLYNAYVRYQGSRVTTSELKRSAPHVFDSKASPAGHDCHCTFFFLVLKRSGLANEIEGAGKPGNPYAVDLRHID